MTAVAVPTHTTARPGRRLLGLPKMMLASIGAYVPNVMLLGAASALGMLEPVRIPQYMAAVAVVYGLVLCVGMLAPNLLGSGARSTFIQMVVAMFPGLWVAGHMQEAAPRIAFVMLISASLIWGVLWLTGRLYVLLAATYAASYAILVLVMEHRQGANVDLRAELTVAAALLICGSSIATLGAYVSSVRRRLGQRSHALRQTLARIEEQTVRDELTGLANRRRLMQRLEAEVARVAGRRRSVAVVLFDLDHFKRVNDHHGHAAGDAVLRRVCDALAQEIRAPHELGRLGGEELLLVLQDTDLQTALREAERLRRVVAALDLADVGESLRVTVSCGVAARGHGARASAIHIDELLQAADRALYRAKSGGRDRVVADEADAAPSDNGRSALAERRSPSHG